MKRVGYIFLILLIPFVSFSQELDSLWQMWNNKDLSDRDRMWAIDEMAWNLAFSEPDSARKLSLLLLNKAKMDGADRWQAIAYNTIGISYYVENNFTKSIENYQQGLRIREKLKDDAGIAAVLGNIGNVYYDMKDYDNALSFQLRSLDIDLKLDNAAGIASSYNNIGNIYKRQGKNDKALEYYKRSLGIKKENNDKRGMANSLNNIGEMYELAGDYRTALGYYEESFQLELELNNKQGETLSLISLAGIYTKFKKYDKALKFIIQAKNMSEEMNFEQGKMQCQLYMYEVYKGKGQKDKALEAYENYIQTRDSLESEDNKVEISRLQIAYEYEKRAMEDSIKNAEKEKVHDAEIAVQNARLEKKQTQLYGMIFGSFLIIVFSIFIVNRVRIISAQKKLIEHQKNAIEEQRRDVMDSIVYARRIQEAILKEQNQISTDLPDHFVFFKPKDIVSGDFYWSSEKQDCWHLAVGDCTGHGVPGAFLTMLGISFLNEINSTSNALSPGEMLDALRAKIIKELNQTGKAGESKDGMDISLVSLSGVKNEGGVSLSGARSDVHSHTLKWSGANNPLWIYRKLDVPSPDFTPINEIKLTDGQVISLMKSMGVNYKTSEYGIFDIKPNKQPISYSPEQSPFSTHNFDLKKGDTFYLITDGYADQFGGDPTKYNAGKKIKQKNFKALIGLIQHHTMSEQKEILAQFFDKWKGDFEQVDDVCVIGVRL